MILDDFQDGIIEDKWIVEGDLSIACPLSIRTICESDRKLSFDCFAHAIDDATFYVRITSKMDVFEFSNIVEFGVSASLFLGSDYPYCYADNHLSFGLKDEYNNVNIISWTTKTRNIDNAYRLIKINNGVEVYINGSYFKTIDVSILSNYYLTVYASACASCYSECYCFADVKLDLTSFHQIIDDEYGSMNGTVIENILYTNVKDATVELFNPPIAPFYNYTDENGSFVFHNVPAGHYLLTIFKEGYELYQDYVDIVQGEITHHPPINLVNLTPDIHYVGLHSISGLSEQVINESDSIISAGDHVHLTLPFRNYGGQVENIPIQVNNIPLQPMTPWLKFSEHEMGPYDYNLELNLNGLCAGTDTTIDIWLYIMCIDPDNIGTTIFPYNPEFELIYGADNKKETIEIILDAVDFRFDCPELKDVFLEEDCLAHPFDNDIKRYAQWACGNYDPNSNSDPDNIIKTTYNVLKTIACEFDIDMSKINEGFPWRGRTNDLECLSRRLSNLGACHHYSDLSTGVLRSLGIPTRRLYGVYNEIYLLKSIAHQWNEIYYDSNWIYYDAITESIECILTGHTKCTVKNAFNNNPPSEVKAETSTLSNNSVKYHWRFCGFPLLPCDNCTVGAEEDVTNQYTNCSIVQLATSSIQQEDSLILKLECPKFVYIDEQFNLKCVIENISETTYDSIGVVIDPLEIDSSLVVYELSDSIKYFYDLAPLSNDTVYFQVIPKLTGNWALISIAFWGNSYISSTAAQQIGQIGLLPRLISNSSICNSNITPLSELCLNASILDTSFASVDDADEVKLIIKSIRPSGLIDSIYLDYNPIDSLYTSSYTLPSNCPLGLYQATVIVQKSGYNNDTTYSYFSVIPSLNLSVFSDSSQYACRDTVEVIARLSDRAYAADSARIMLSIESNNNKLYSTQMEHISDSTYYCLFIPEEIINPICAYDSLDALCKLIFEAEYCGGYSRDSLEILVNIPNLSFRGVYFSPDTLFDDDYLTVTFGVENTGTDISDSTVVRFFKDAINNSSLLSGDIKVGGLEPSEIVYYSFNLSLYDMQGCHHIYAIIDQDNYIVDSDRSNNQTTNIIRIYGRTTDVEWPDNDKDIIPNSYRLTQNHPNPFNPITTIQYEIPRNSYVNLRIYDVAGRLLSVLVAEKKESGFYQAIWDGKDKHGHEVSSGVYFYQLQAGEFKETRKLVILR